jgi:hypothetical protein
LAGFIMTTEESRETQYFSPIGEVASAVTPESERSLGVRSPRAYLVYSPHNRVENEFLDSTG